MFVAEVLHYYISFPYHCDFFLFLVPQQTFKSILAFIKVASRDYIVILLNYRNESGSKIDVLVALFLHM